MNCWSCQSDNPPSAKFCFDCGSRLVPDPLTEGPCRVCAAPLPLDARFCGYCGTPDPLVVAPSAEPTEPVAPETLEQAYDSAAEEEDEATVLRPELAQAPIVPARPGIKSRERLRTEPAKMASARTLAERLGRPPGESPGAYSKQGPSLRNNAPKAPPPPPIGAARKGGAPPPASPRKADTARHMPRAGLPQQAVAGSRPSSPGLTRPAAPGEAAPARGPMPARSPTPRPTTAPAAALRSTDAARDPRAPRSEAAVILAPPEGWPDITDELAEVRFSTLQGLEEDVLAEVEVLRRKYPGHPEVEALAVELGAGAAVASSPSRPPMPSTPSRPPVPAGVTPMSGPPPRGRFPTGPQPVAEPVPPGPRSRSGAPGPAPIETSDELLDVDATEFDALDEPGPDESMSDLTLVDDMGLGGLDPYDDETDEPEEPDFVDRTMAVPSLQPPAPYQDGPPGALESRPPEPLQPRSPADRRATLPPELEAVDARRSSTLAPGIDRLDDDERSTTLPPGGLVIDRDEPPTLTGMGFDADDPPTLSGPAFDDVDNPPTLSGMAYERDEPPTLADIDARDLPAFVHDEDSPLPGPGPAPRRSSTLVPQIDDDGPPPPAPYAGPGGEPPPEPGMFAPDRDADTAAASGTFNVADLRLDDMPDLASGPPPELDLDDLDELDTDDSRTTHEGTVVARAPVPPAPYGQGQAQVPVLPVRLVMLGARGEAVAERRIEPGAYLDLGRRPGEPWGEDRRMEPLHARLFPGPGGVVIDDFGLPNGVYTQIFDTIAVEDGDEFKVGQARLALQRFVGPGGSWGQLTIVRHDSPSPETVRMVGEEVILGREEGDVTFPSDTFVSGDHCRFVREGHAVYLEDLGSSNGTYIRVRAGQCVAYGGLVLVGHTQFKVLPE